jgi:hypothetical protein
VISQEARTLHRKSLGRLAALLLALAGALAADDPSNAIGNRRADGVLRRIDFEEGATFWAFQPPQSAPLPRVSQPSWIRQSLDAFVLARLDEAGLEPSRRAKKTTLLRRATFDLVGLPPSPSEVAAFLDDESPTAFDRVVDRLLASPHFGERWGRHWLDVVRYSDSNGLDENIHFGHAWRYRDYVVSAFNRDKSYDRFVSEHLAGDLLTAKDEDPESYLDRMTAGTFLAIGPKMVAEQDNRKRAMDTLDELVNVISRAFLAQTVACARCHDHKYDPISTRDYYALAGIFASAMGEKGLHKSIPASTEPAVDVKLLARQRELEGTLEELRQQAISQLDAEHARAATYIERALPLSRRTLELAARDVTSQEKPAGKGTETRALEYPITLTEGGTYLLAASYQSQESRPLRLRLDGELVDERAFAVATGSIRREDRPSWFPIRLLEITSGQHILRLEREDELPSITHLALIPNGPDAAGNDGWQASQPGLRDAIFLRWLHALNAERHHRDSHLRPVFALTANGAIADAEVTQQTTRIAQELGDLRRETTGLKRELIEQRAVRVGPAISRLVLVPGAPLRTPRQPEVLFPALWKKCQELTAALATTRKKMRSRPQVHAMHDGPPQDLPVHIRGSHLDLEAEAVPRGFLAVTRDAVRAPVIPSNAVGRLQLAQWLTDRRHPLTARVMVNRVWQTLFGMGLVPTASNFGFRGERPSHPELLDALAVEFSQDWSIKKLIRTIVLSSTYAQASHARAEAAAQDPENRLLWRHNRRRLEAEAIRDTLLATAGELERHIGGTLFKFNDGKRVTNDQSANASTRTYKTKRRALYLPVIRMALYPMFTDFDLNDTTLPIPRRGSTVVASQALFMMNSPLVRESAAAFAKSLLSGPALTPEARIRETYLRAYAREVRPRELTLSLAYLEQTRATAIRADGLDGNTAERTAWRDYCQTILATHEFIYIH